MRHCPAGCGRRTRSGAGRRRDALFEGRAEQVMPDPRPRASGATAMPISTRHRRGGPAGSGRWARRPPCRPGGARTSSGAGRRANDGGPRRRSGRAEARRARHGIVGPGKEEGFVSGGRRPQRDRRALGHAGLRATTLTNVARRSSSVAAGYVRWTSASIVEVISCVCLRSNQGMIVRLEPGAHHCRSKVEEPHACS